MRGYSPKVDSSALVGEYGFCAAELGIDIFIDRVESKSNPSDGPSRLDCSTMSLYNARCVQHNLPDPFHQLFLFTGLALHPRLCSLRWHTHNRWEEREVPISSVGTRLPLLPRGEWRPGSTYPPVTLSGWRRWATDMSYEGNSQTHRGKRKEGAERPWAFSKWSVLSVEYPRLVLEPV